MKKLVVFCFITFASLGALHAQSYWSYDDHGLSLKMPEISLISVMPANYTVNLSLGLPDRAGDKPGETGDSKDDNTWLNYSCSRKYRGSFKKVYAQITSGSVPDGLAVNLEVKKSSTKWPWHLGSTIFKLHNLIKPTTSCCAQNRRRLHTKGYKFWTPINLRTQTYRHRPTGRR